MKINISILSLIFAISTLNSQNGVELTPYGGVNTPLGYSNNYSELGPSFGVSLDKFISKKVAWGFDINHQANRFNNFSDYSSIKAPYSLQNTEAKSWSMSSLTFGPTYRIGQKKFTMDMYLKGGVSLINSPAQTYSITGAGIDPIKVFESKEETLPSLAITSGMRFNYAVSDKVSLSLNPQYIFNGQGIEYFKRHVPQGDLNPTALAEDGGSMCDLRIQNFSVNGGVKVLLGGEKSISKNIEEKTSCIKTELLKPYNNESFTNSIHSLPVFEWNNRSENVKFFNLKIYNEEGQLVYEKNSKNHKEATDKKLQNIFNDNINKKLKWNITTYYKDCSPNISENRIFLIAKSQCEYEITNLDINCNNPAFDSNQNVNYSGVIEVKNSSSSNGLLMVHPSSNITQHIGINTSGTLNVYNSGLSGNCPMVPLVNGNSYAPGQIAKYCFDLSVPIGTTTIKFLSSIRTNANTDSFADCHAPKQIDLKPCICDICKDDWQIEVSNLYFRGFGLRNKIKILNADPIKGIKAEIVSLQHQVNDEQCYTCTKDHKRMGLFSINGMHRITPIAGWQNNGQGVLSDENNDGYGNQYSWCAQFSTGVDMSEEKQFNFNVSLPLQSSLECCHSLYKICVRYTFTDINCQSCDTLICFEYDTRDKDGSSPWGTGNGNDIIKDAEIYTIPNGGGRTPIPTGMRQENNGNIINNKNKK